MVREEGILCSPEDLVGLSPRLRGNIESLSRGGKKIELSFESIMKFIPERYEEISCVGINNVEDFIDTFTSDIVPVDSCLFICSKNVKFDEMYFNKIIEEYGSWKAQGINNHIHLCEYSDDVIVQRLIGYFIIKKFLGVILRLDVITNVCFYVNGDNRLSLCIYSCVDIDDSFLIEFDNYLGMNGCRITSMIID